MYHTTYFNDDDDDDCSLRMLFVCSSVWVNIYCFMIFYEQDVVLFDTNYMYMVCS